MDCGRGSPRPSRIARHPIPKGGSIRRDSHTDLNDVTCAFTHTVTSNYIPSSLTFAPGEGFVGGGFASCICVPLLAALSPGTSALETLGSICAIL